MQLLHYSKRVGGGVGKGDGGGAKLLLALHVQIQ